MTSIPPRDQPPIHGTDPAEARTSRRGRALTVALLLLIAAVVVVVLLL